LAATGRPWWQARYRDGRVISEWDTLPRLAVAALPGQLAALGPRSQWEQLAKVGMIGARLLCPDGTAGEVEARRDHAIFQFKVGQLRINVPRPHLCEAQVIGVVTNDAGDCDCVSWEMRERRLVHFQDNVHRFAYRGVGPLGLANLELKV
jgi:hypothetical protein